MAEASFSFPFRSSLLVSSTIGVKDPFCFPSQDCVLVSLTSPISYHIPHIIVLRFIHLEVEKSQLCDGASVPKNCALSPKSICAYPHNLPTRIDGEDGTPGPTKRAQVDHAGSGTPHEGVLLPSCCLALTYHLSTLVEGVGITP